MANEIKVQLHQVSPTTAEAAIRSHRVAVDRPTSKGGADLGPMGGELFLASVGGCFLSNLFAAGAARNAGISGVTAEVTGTLAESPARFSGIEIFLTADATNQEMLEHLVEIADRSCIMMNTLRGKLDVKIRTGAIESAK